jgi:prolyl oligopeptidase
VEEENKVTFGYLEKIPYRMNVQARLEKLFNYAKYSAPFRNGDSK